MNDMDLFISKDLALGFTKTSGEYPTGEIGKGLVQFTLRKNLGKHAFIVVKPFEMMTDTLFRAMK